MEEHRLSVFAAAYRIASGMIAGALIAAILHVSIGVGTNQGGFMLATGTLVGSMVGLLSTFGRAPWITLLNLFRQTRSSSKYRP